MTLENLIQRYLDGGLDAEGVADLDKFLRHSEDARKSYWKICEIHCLLDHAFAERSGADWAVPVEQPKSVLPVWISGVLAAVIAVAATWWVIQWQDVPTSSVVATAKGGSEVIERGLLSLAAGEAREITFLTGVRVALEGPLEMELVSRERMKLLYGKIGVEVPKGAEGFTVETPDGEVIDYGTRFGLSVGREGDLRAEVFEGRIDVVIGKKVHRMEGQKSLEVSGHTQSLTPGSDASSFPMPSVKEIWGVGGSFNTPKSYASNRPKIVGGWSGDLVSIAGRYEDVVPRRGNGMLQFQGTSAQADMRSTTVSQLWRIVDLYEVAKKMGRRPERVTLSAWVNSVTGNAQTDRAFRFGLSCHEEITEALDEDSAVTTKVKTSLFSDSDPGTWERADLQLQLPSKLRYLVIMVGASEDVFDDTEGPEFEGHFLDDLDLIFKAGMRPSVDIHYWRGSEGAWENSAKWSENRQPSWDSYVVIQGPGTARIGETVNQNAGHLVIALDNDSEGSLYLPPNKTLNLGSSEGIVGHNQGAVAHAHISGELRTGGRFYVGRNNARSTLLLTGTFISSDLIQLSQYDSTEDTVAELMVEGGSLQAGALRLINDQSSVVVNGGGTIKVDELRLGGDNGEATLTIEDGEVYAKDFILGEGVAKARLNLQGGLLKIEKLHRGEGEFQLNLFKGEIWIKMPVSELADILPNSSRSTRGEWTVYSTY